jgi:hypothetical protein
MEDTDDTESDYTCKICGTDPKQIADGTNSEETLAKSLLLEENLLLYDLLYCQCHHTCLPLHSHLFVLRFVMGLAFVVL